MARFANDCRARMHEVLIELEEKLGEVRFLFLNANAATNQSFYSCLTLYFWMLTMTYRGRQAWRFDSA
jgi:hypothetical protein